MLPILAQAAVGTLAHWLIVAIVAAGIVAIFLVVASQTGLKIPAWFVQVLWILIAVVVGVAAIHFLVSML